MADAVEPKEQKPEKAPANLNAKPQTAKGSNKTLFIIIGVIAFFVIVLPMILFFVVFGVIKNKVNKDLNSGIVSTASGGKVQVSSNGKEVTVKGADGSEMSSSQKLPADWPTAVVIYTPNTIVGSYKATQDGKPSWTLATTTPDTYDKVKADIASKYAGWAKSSEYEASGALISVYDKDTYSVVITITQPTKNDGSDNKVAVNYSVTTK